MAIDHVDLLRLRWDLSIRPLAAEERRMAGLLFAGESLSARAGSAEYGALCRLVDLHLAELDEECWNAVAFLPTDFLIEIEGNRLWNVLETAS